jgi:hypothetical protein
MKRIALIAAGIGVAVGSAVGVAGAMMSDGPRRIPPIDVDADRDRPERGPWPGDVDGDGAVSDSGDETIPAFVPAIGVEGREGWIEYEAIEEGLPGTEVPVVDEEGRQIDLFRVG